MWLDWVSNPGPLGLESDALTTVLCGPADQFASPGCCCWLRSRSRSEPYKNLVFAFALFFLKVSVGVCSSAAATK